METLTTVTVAESDLDDLGHANNARYLEYLEQGRRRWYVAAGLLGTEAMPDPAGLGAVAANIDINFRRECHAGDVLTVRTWPARRGRKSWVLAQAIEGVDGQRVADAEVTMVLIDVRARRTLVLPEAVGSLFPET